ncbi:hypothetical protein C2E23DRAFT_594530 [Lenzites betulinus]|nr:hypothetical protein C2E23DRAFT_594530 [Lenzites betulinus]
MENVDPLAMNGDDAASLNNFFHHKRNVKASRQKRSLARSNADNEEDNSPDDSGLLTPPSSQNADDMDPARMLFSPPPEEVLRGNDRHSVLRARSVPVQLPFTPSLLADPPPLGAASSKRKRHAHNRSASHTTFSSIAEVTMASIPPAEATPNPKPRKQSKRIAPTITVDSPTRSSAGPADEPSTPTRASSQRRSQSPTKRSLLLSPHHSNPEADYIAPLPVISRQTLSSRRRSATPIPPYEPPRERFTPPREIIHTPPPAAHSPSKVSKSSKRKSVTLKQKKKLVIQVKTEPPDVDLLEPPPPPSPTDDPLLLKGQDRPRRQHKPRASALSTSSSTHARETPSIASSSPVSPPREDGVSRLPDLNSSMDISMHDVSFDSMDDSFAGPSVPVFNFTDAPEVSGVWDDQDSDDDSEEFDQTGEYTGRFKVLTVPTKADPPSSCTRTRQEAWGHPISPFPSLAGRRTSLPSSPPLRAGPDDDDGLEMLESPDEDDVFFLEGPVDVDSVVVADADTSQETVQESEESMEIHETLRARSPTRSPSPLPIIDMPEPATASTSHHPTAHHVRFVARKPSEEQEEDSSMHDISLENDRNIARDSPSPPPSAEQHSLSLEPQHVYEDAHMSVLHDNDRNAVHTDPQDENPEEQSDASDVETVDRELSREPESESEDEAAPAPRAAETPPLPSLTRIRSMSPQAGQQPRPRGFLSIASPLRRQKSPQALARSLSPMEMPMPSIQSMFATPVAPRPYVEDAPESSSPIRENAVREETQETAVEEHDMEMEEGNDANAAADVEDGSGDESEELDDGVIKITSDDPRAAARAAAILKMHDYDFIIKDESRKRRFSSVDSAMRNARRKSVLAGGISKQASPMKRRRTFGGVLGDKVIIPGSPVMTIPELLHEAERSVEQRERSMHTPARATSFLNDTGLFKVPLDRPAFETPGPRQRVHSRPMFNPNGPRSWDKDDWKLLDACFTDERLALGSHKRPIGEAILAPVDDVDLDRVIDRFMEQTGGVPNDDCWVGWTREDLLRRTRALQKKQRSGKVAPPTPSGRFASAALSEVPDFTPLPSRQSSVQPWLQRRESTVSVQSTKTTVPASLLAPRYSHLLDEAIAISKGESSSHSSSQPVGYRSMSMPAPDSPAHAVENVGNVTIDVSAMPPPSKAIAEQLSEPLTPSRSIASRMKGFFFSYLPTATKKTQTKKPATPAHPGLPIPPPEMFQKPRAPISTPVSKPPTKTVPPKELVQFNHVPPPKPSMIPRLAQKPRRLVDLHPAPPPEPRPRSSLSILDRRSSSGSVKDLVKSFETLEKQQEREQQEEGTHLHRARSVSEWAAATTGGRAQSAQSQKRTWKP